MNIKSSQVIIRYRWCNRFHRTVVLIGAAIHDVKFIHLYSAACVRRGTGVPHKQSAENVPPSFQMGSKVDTNTV